MSVAAARRERKKKIERERKKKIETVWQFLAKSKPRTPEDNLGRAKYRPPAGFPSGAPRGAPELLMPLFSHLARDANARGIQARPRSRGTRAGRSSGAASGSRIAGRRVAGLARRDATRVPVPGPTVRGER
jgi:hypothetical protein